MNNKIPRIDFFGVSILFMFIMSVHTIAAEEIIPLINFFSLESTLKEEMLRQNQLIQIRGFLYEANDSTLILSAEPHLKTCCIGRETKKYKQLLVSGNLINEATRENAITLQGNLTTDLNHRYPFQLQNASVIKENQLSLVDLGIGLTLIFFFLTGIFIAFRHFKPDLAPLNHA